jgi:hypothetical protein
MTAPDDGEAVAVHVTGLRSRDLLPVLRGLLVLCLGVLGWLAVQAATFGIAEHTHLTARGELAHSHGYAAPLAAVAGLVATLAVLGLVALHLTDHRSTPAAVAPWLSGRGAAAAAVVAFVGVEAVEVGLSASSIGPVALVVGLGAGAQAMVVPAALGLGRLVARAVATLADPPPGASTVPPTSPVAVAGGRGPAVTAARFAWDGRAPPGPALLPPL